MAFSDPNLAIIGHSCRELSSLEILIGENVFHSQGRAFTVEKNKGVIRIYAEPNSGKLLGAEMCLLAGEHLAHLLALAIQQQLSVRQLFGLPFYHPVLEESLRTTLRDLVCQLPESRDTDLANCGSFGYDALD